MDWMGYWYCFNCILCVMLMFAAVIAELLIYLAVYFSFNNRKLFIVNFAKDLLTNEVSVLVRNLDFLSIPKEFSKVEVEIYENQSIALVYIEGKCYSLVLKQDNQIDSIFLLKTNILPNNVNDHQDRQDFINVIKMLLDKIYSVADIKEYEKQHQEHVFLRLMDMFDEGKVDLINEENSKVYSDIEKGFMKLEIDIMDNKINALNSSISDVSKNLQSTVDELEENTWGNKIRKTINQQ